MVVRGFHTIYSSIHNISWAIAWEYEKWRAKTREQRTRQASECKRHEAYGGNKRTKEREDETKDLKLKHEDDNQEQNTTEKTFSKPREFVCTLLTAQEMKILNDLILYSMVALCRRGANARSEKVLWKSNSNNWCEWNENIHKTENKSWQKKFSGNENCRDEIFRYCPILVASKMWMRMWTLSHTYECSWLPLHIQCSLVLLIVL